LVRGRVKVRVEEGDQRLQGRRERGVGGGYSETRGTVAGGERGRLHIEDAEEEEK
jgi:hypothetical protein